ICSWFLIGFYFERHSASTAANKAFIVNRVGDFGMLIGLMALWGGLGTLHFGDSVSSATGQVEPGLFELVRPAENHHEQQVPDGLVAFAAADQIEKMA
ncbi:MAG TPA: NADH-quinone oxidoreductase subunit L, partial [Planctomycetaceae bacterium]|nr:NADH-quinone oxidoreductase subunit L [Planctomycetaceae bacterium]